MKLLILGGTGATGKHLVEKALRQNHGVTVLVRDAAKVGASNPNLTVVKGDATNAAELERVVTGKDAVLSALGARHKADTICADAATAAGLCHGEGEGETVGLALGERRGRQRGAADERKIRLRKNHHAPLSREPYANHARAEETLRASELEWTVLRPVQLVEAPTGRKPTAVPIGSSKVDHLKISRADVADFMLTEVAARAHVRQMPILQG